MASSGTLLSDLADRVPVSKDDDLVSQIMSEMNRSPSPANPVMSAPSGPPQQAHTGMIYAPNPNQTHPAAMDPATATAHMIGKQYPTTADFANMMHAPSYYGGAPMGSPYQSAGPAGPAAPPLAAVESRGYADILAQLKQPVMVAIIIFLVSLPIVNVLMGHYLPSLLRVGGDLTMLGMALKSALGGALFWLLQRVVVPLLS
jgi:hypothetical protein